MPVSSASSAPSLTGKRAGTYYARRDPGRLRHTERADVVDYSPEVIGAGIDQGARGHETRDRLQGYGVSLAMGIHEQLHFDRAR